MSPSWKKFEKLAKSGKWENFTKKLFGLKGFFSLILNFLPMTRLVLALAIISERISPKAEAETLPRISFKRFEESRLIPVVHERVLNLSNFTASIFCASKAM